MDRSSLSTGSARAVRERRNKNSVFTWLQRGSLTFLQVISPTLHLTPLYRFSLTRMTRATNDAAVNATNSATSSVTSGNQKALRRKRRCND